MEDRISKDVGAACATAESSVPLKKSIGLAALQSQAVCVLGMHRSGTSSITRLLNLLGVYLGSEEQFLPIAADNPKGHWELQSFNKLNDYILAQYGLTWDSLEALPQDWAYSVELLELYRHADKMLQNVFAQAPLWGWKDPRTCLTLPFWQLLIGDLKYVICLRNPLDVAESLRRRNGFTPAKSYALWLKHVQTSLLHTLGRPRLFIFYEDVMANRQFELDRLANFLGRSALVDHGIRQAADEFVTGKLYHHSTSVLATMDHPALSFPVKAQFLALRLYVDSQQKGSPAVVAEERSQQDALAYLIQHAAQASFDQAAQLKQIAESKRLSKEQHLTIEALSIELQRLADDRQQMMNSLTATVAEQKQALQAMAAQLMLREQAYQELSLSLTKQEQMVNELNHTLTEITGSRAWKLMHMLWQIRRTLVPRTKLE